jgi:bifunctional non-homologous end joining protein LigD
MGQERPPIVFYVFDLLQLNGKNLQNLPIEERKAKLKGLLIKPRGVIDNAKGIQIFPMPSSCSHVVDKTEPI